MLNLAIYGNTKWSIILKECLENEYSELLKEVNGETVSVKYTIVSEMSSDNEIDYNTMARLYHEKKINAIVIPKEYYMQYNEIIQNLVIRQININDIYNGMRLNEKMHEILKNNKALIPELITPMLNDSYLSYLEYHVADHCNLNCKYCTHYSPLVKGDVFTDINSLEKDLLQLKKYIDDIGIIRILGGEPLLNKKLPEFIKLTRKIYPKSIITIVTNGMIVDRMSEELMDAIKDNMAFIHISYYPPLEERIETIKRFLVDNKMLFTMSPKMEVFMKMQTLNRNDSDDFFYSCFQATCTAIHNGKLAACYAPFTTKYFNEAFNQNIPENEGIDLYAEDITTDSLKLKLLYPMERCRYCTCGKAYPWEIVGKNSILEDWVYE